jgi:hypothetical protein
MDLASRSRTCQTVRAARSGRQSWLFKRLRPLVRQAKSHPTVGDTCWTTAEDTCSTIALAVCSRSESAAADTTTIAHTGLPRCPCLRCSRKRVSSSHRAGGRPAEKQKMQPARNLSRQIGRLSSKSGEQIAAINRRVWLSLSASARLLGLIAAAVQNTRWFSSIHPAALLWVPMRAASWPS